MPNSATSTSPTPARPGRLARAAPVFAAWTAFGLLIAQQTALGRLRGETRAWFQLRPRDARRVDLGAVHAARRRRHALAAARARAGLARVAAARPCTVARRRADRRRRGRLRQVRPYLDGVHVDVPERVRRGASCSTWRSYAVVVALVEALAYAAPSASAIARPPSSRAPRRSSRGSSTRRGSTRSRASSGRTSCTTRSTSSRSSCTTSPTRPTRCSRGSASCCAAPAARARTWYR